MKSSTFPNRFGLWYNSLVKNCNHKGLGIYYLLTAFIFGISGTLISVLIRIELYFVLLMKSHLQSYPCPLQINSFWNLGLLLGITIILQIIHPIIGFISQLFV